MNQPTAYTLTTTGPVVITLSRPPDIPARFTVTSTKTGTIAVIAPDGRRLASLAPGQSVTVYHKRGAYRRVPPTPKPTRTRRKRATVRTKGAHS